MSLFTEIFSWWGGNTWGTRYTLWKTARFIGKDDLGNTYYEQKEGVGPHGMPRRYVLYTDLADASKVPPEWHGWLHHTVKDPPSEEDYKPRDWQLPHKMNMTGTRHAYRPKGSILTPEKREPTTGDYKAWKPE
ncbi:MAG: NADH:ubiquinone oxidoreductase subunit NDUFA12 [Pseudomonadota bacterium]